MAEQTSTQNQKSQSQKPGGMKNADLGSKTPSRSAGSQDQSSNGTTDGGRKAGTSAEKHDNDREEVKGEGMSKGSGNAKK